VPVPEDPPVAPPRPAAGGHVAGAPPKRRWSIMRPHVPGASHPVIANFFGDRCPHLAAMLAYYALLSLVPFLFLALSLVGLTGRADEHSLAIRELRRALPGQPIDDLIAFVSSLRRNARTLGVVGAVGLVWSSLGLLSALESALNIVYQVPNRPFWRQKIVVAAMATSVLGALFAALAIAASLSTWLDTTHLPLLDRVGGELIVTVVTVVFSTGAAIGFLFVVYRYLPNTEVATREVWPGVAFAALVLQASFQLLPVYLRFASTLATLKAFGGIAVLLVWFYLMGNVLLLGAEINWWYGRGRHATPPEFTGP
jgi:membrane protein